MKRFAALGLILLGLAACAPVPRAEAERQCYDEARLAAGPRGEIRIGAAGGRGQSTRGVLGAGLEVSTDYLAGRDPEQVWQRCVMSRSGELPSRPFHTVPPEAYRPAPGRFF